MEEQSENTPFEGIPLPLHPLMEELSTHLFTQKKEVYPTLDSARAGLQVVIQRKLERGATAEEIEKLLRNVLLNVGVSHDRINSIIDPWRDTFRSVFPTFKK